MASIEEKRAFVYNMYPGKHWKTKVKHMPDIQITAIYLKEMSKGEQPKPAKETKDEIPF